MFLLMFVIVMIPLFQPYGINICFNALVLANENVVSYPNVFHLLVSFQEMTKTGTAFCTTQFLYHSSGEYLFTRVGLR